MNDLKFAFRQLLKNPGFAAVAVLTLGLSIGANLAIFAVVDAILVRSLPLPGGPRSSQVSVAGRASKGAAELVVYAANVSPDYFRTLGIPLLKGCFRCWQ